MCGAQHVGAQHVGAGSWLQVSGETLSICQQSPVQSTPAQSVSHQYPALASSTAVARLLHGSFYSSFSAFKQFAIPKNCYFMFLGHFS